MKNVREPQRAFWLVWAWQVGSSHLGWARLCFHTHFWNAGTNCKVITASSLLSYGISDLTQPAKLNGLGLGLDRGTLWGCCPHPFTPPLLKITWLHPGAWKQIGYLKESIGGQSSWG